MMNNIEAASRFKNKIAAAKLNLFDVHEYNTVDNVYTFDAYYHNAEHTKEYAIYFRFAGYSLHREEKLIFCLKYEDVYLINTAFKPESDNELDIFLDYALKVCKQIYDYNNFFDECRLTNKLPIAFIRKETIKKYLNEI